MEIGGWILMIFSVGTVVTLFVWCLWKVLFCSPADTPEHLHGGLDIDTHDSDES
ncbi:MAG: hypothetical protein MUC91_09905 [Verrucomicrobia bacterium]|jgi:hypothetical protein|nr:hypothetical protein [Verrucomicrobiota bacterium]